MDEAFSIYLPSNACEQIYPNNKSSDYKTRLKKAIQLQGDWEVGVESVFYSSKIDKKKEKAEVHCKVNALKERYLYRGLKKTKQFVLNPSINWKQRVEILPDVFEADPKNLGGVLNTLNDMNEYLAENKEYPAFSFTKDSFSMNKALEHFYIFMTPRLLNVLGYRANTILTTKGAWAKSNRKVSDDDQLTREDYRLKIFNADAKYAQTRIVIKAKGTTFDGGEDKFLDLWKRTVQSANKAIEASFKHKKLIIDNYNNDLAIVFSPNLIKIVGHTSPIFGRSTTWSRRKAKLKKGYSTGLWYIDIFNIHPKQLTKEVKYEFTINLYPWKCDSMENVMKYVNSEVEKVLKEKLDKMFNDYFYEFKLTLLSNGYSKLVLGPRLDVDFSKNLYRLFGMTKGDLQGKPVLHAMRHITNEMRHEERVFLLSNIARTTGYGQHHTPMLRSFLHNPKKSATNSDVIEKHFEPIIYLPLLSNNIDMIDIQLTNAVYQPIDVDDHTTIVCLYFRKVDEKSV